MKKYIIEKLLKEIESLSQYSPDDQKNVMEILNVLKLAMMNDLVPQLHKHLAPWAVAAIETICK